MEHYKISQSPTKKAPKPKIKDFWVSKGQKKTLSKKTVFGTIGGALVVIGVGTVFAVLHIRGQVTPIHTSIEPLGSNSAPSKGASGPVYAVSQQAFSDASNAVTSNKIEILNSSCALEVRVVIVSSNVNELLPCSSASSLIDNALSKGDDPWNFRIPSSELAYWQTGPYGQYFDGVSVVGESANGEVVSIGYNTSGEIISITIAPSTSLAPPPSNSSNNNSSSGDDNSSPTEGTPTPTSQNATD